jgi:pyruvate dehydrogenase E2 component (dihydrolipoamide acetyltransferase)
MEEGTILTWMKQVGDEVAVGEELVEIETDKANMAYESDVAGTLTEIVAQEGDTLPVGDPIARIGGAEAADSTAAPAATTAPAAEREPVSPAATEQRPAPAISAAAANGARGGDGARRKASPIARRLAREMSIDLTNVEGSGPGGRIVKEDVSRAVEASGRGGGSAEEPAATRAATESAKGTVTVEELSKLQATVARRMAESKATAPHFYLEAEIDMTHAMAARARLKAAAAEGEVLPSVNDMVVKACALALREHPHANGSYRDGHIEVYSRVNVGVAVAADDGLVVPTIFDADSKGLRQIATDSRALAGRVRAGTITPPELSGGTFTVSNLGMYGIDNFSAAINLPQAAILGVGQVKERPVVRDGELTSAETMLATLSCDHRILYGAAGAQFLARVRELLEEPLALAL